MTVKCMAFQIEGIHAMATGEFFVLIEGKPYGPVIGNCDSVARKYLLGKFLIGILTSLAGLVYIFDGICRGYTVIAVGRPYKGDFVAACVFRFFIIETFMNLEYFVISEPSPCTDISQCQFLRSGGKGLPVIPYGTCRGWQERNQSGFYKIVHKIPGGCSGFIDR